MEISQVDLSFIRTQANTARHDYIEEMENKLIAFDRRMNEKGFKVYWVSDENELTDLVFDLIPQTPYNKFCFDLANTPEAFRNTKAIKPIHFADVESGAASATYLFTQADFAVVETGTLVLLNKNSKNLLNRIPKIFVLLDISKLVNRPEDLELFLYLRSFYQEGNYLPDDVKLINHPFQLVEKDIASQSDEPTKQPVQISIFLYDNGVTHIMQDPVLRESLYCIDCGRCKTVCPMYEYAKEHTPIGIVRDNCLHHAHDTEHIVKNAMLCGNCDQVCPVQIPISDLILREIELSRQQHGGTSHLAKTFERRKKLNKMNGALRRHFFTKHIYGKNKMLHSYFKQQNNTFYNITWLQENAEDDK
ncbi:MAG: LUD domain-containing protein [Bacteroidales bacterium]|nr:LUD domain-containing protein [Bacteroidales bacterium]